MSNLNEHMAIFGNCQTEVMKTILVLDFNQFFYMKDMYLS